MIPYGRQSISDEDIQVVVDVLKSDFLTQGPVVPAFEQAVCDYTGAKYAVAVNSGTAALHIACKALGLGEGDWLWTTPITFVASANCGLYCGASIDFVDIDPASWNISVDKLEEKLKLAKQEMRVPKVFVAVHLAGLSCDMEAIRALSKEYGFFVIEDACHAIGGKYQQQPIGCGLYSDITVFSFHPVKTITTGEGGMAVTNDKTISDKMALLRGHGITRDPNQMSCEPHGAWYYQQIELGYNYRMTDIQAALGISQLRRLDAFVGSRYELASRYDELLADLPVQCQLKGKDKYSGLHLYIVRMKNEISSARDAIFDYMRENGIGVQVHYIPVHTQPYYQQICSSNRHYPEAESYYSEAMSLPMYPELKMEQQQFVVSTLKEAILLHCGT